MEEGEGKEEYLISGLEEGVPQCYSALPDQTHLECSVSLAPIQIMVKCSTPRDGLLGRQKLRPPYWKWDECGNWAF